MRDDFSAKTINTLSRRAGFRCSNPNCRKLTVGSNEIRDKSTLIGVAAHITAAAAGGPRFDRSLSPIQRSSIENAIWLCANCSTLIDKDFGKFDIDLLNKWKDDLETETANELRSNSINSTLLPNVEEISLEKSAFDKSLEEFDKVSNKIALDAQKQTILQTEEGVKLANNEVFYIFNYIKDKLSSIELRASSNLKFAKEEEHWEPTFIFKSEGFSCSIIFKQRYSNSLTDSILTVGYWNGHYTRKTDVVYFSEKDRPQNILYITYKFALDDKMNNCWIPDNDKNTYYYSSTMMDKLISWILIQITEKRQKKYR